MIELIFALVIMGITLTAAPLLINVSKNGAIVGIQQEGISEAVAKTNMVLTYSWDQADVVDACIPPMLHVTNGDDELEMNTATARRVGVPLATLSHSFKCETQEFNATSSLGSETGETEANDIDDFINAHESLTVSGVGSGGVDYLEESTVNIATSVSYLNDSAEYDAEEISYIPSLASGGTTNIKQVTVTLTSTSSDTDLVKTVVLKAFSCNIGSHLYKWREI